MIIGGKPKYDEALKGIEELGLPELLGIAAVELVKGFNTLVNGGELPLKIVELKSISDMIWRGMERTSAPLYHHKQQCWHYIKALKIPGELCYINRDNLLVMEFPVDDSANELYESDIKTMTGYFNANQRPPLEDEILFDKDLFRFGKNYKVEYSEYLSMLYGYSTPEAYRERYDKLISSFNRTMKRCIKGDKMTKLNLDTIDEAKKLFPDWDTYVDLAKAKGITTEEEVEE